ncbi:rod shape-determining protein MreD [Candidatus Epulonipiscium fishelsonii]|uniref:Rod shape-determining protein MreD n=1 Tax=Candidatus Epulonipiscium fishelsonii TaxID=77094 RepID=A0ACC8XEN0_9FIRM|nr:rod shape-determining protein MreD [Epulopiscium sp. SCG-B05WGA-EpuloA1]ONI41235.1 rod shape-determining protein MreD [Epulopiscium sp. SCG-B11WGA-EpuloA1]
MRIVTIGGLILTVHILQSTVFNLIRINSIAPNFFVMIIVSFSLLRGSKEGAIMGLFAGILYDLSFGVTFGFAFSYMLLGFLCGRLTPNFYRENFILPFICTFLGDIFINSFVVVALILRGQTNIIYFLKEIILPEIIYTSALTIFIYQISYKINLKLEIVEKRTRNIF